MDEIAGRGGKLPISYILVRTTSFSVLNFCPAMQTNWWNRICRSILSNRDGLPDSELLKNFPQYSGDVEPFAICEELKNIKVSCKECRSRFTVAFAGFAGTYAEFVEKVEELHADSLLLNCCSCYEHKLLLNAYSESQNGYRSRVQEMIRWLQEARDPDLLFGAIEFWDPAEKKMCIFLQNWRREAECGPEMRKFKLILHLLRKNPLDAFDDDPETVVYLRQRVLQM